MAISLYLPKDISSVAEAVIALGSTVSPNYISSPVVSPSILKRNLTATKSLEELVFNTSPLVLPISHSTGDPLKARSFDFDFIVSNSTGTETAPVFMLDTCESTFILEYTGVGEIGVDIDYGQFTTYNFDVKDTTGTLISPSSLNLKFASMANMETIEVGAITGLRNVKALSELELPKENLRFAYDEVEMTLQLTLFTEDAVTVTPIVEKIDIAIQNRSIHYSNLRVVGEVNYEPTINTFYPNLSVVEDIPNMRDELDKLGAVSYLAYSFDLLPKKGILFNIEVGTTDEESYTAITTPTIFQKTSLRIFDETVVEPPIIPEP